MLVELVVLLYSGAWFRRLIELVVVKFINVFVGSIC